MSAKPISTGGQAASCYFRTSVEKPHRKALIQIDERCNLHCVHCFVSATNHGSSMPLADMENILVPRLSGRPRKYVDGSARLPKPEF